MCFLLAILLEFPQIYLVAENLIYFRQMRCRYLCFTISFMFHVGIVVLKYFTS